MIHDEKGKIIRNSNNDDKEHFPFTIKDLIKKFKKEMGIDITDSRNVRGIARGATNEGDPYTYKVNLWVKTLEEYSYYEIDGKTGAVLEKIKLKDLEQKPDYVR